MRCTRHCVPPLFVFWRRRDVSGQSHGLAPAFVPVTLIRSRKPRKLSPRSSASTRLTFLAGLTGSQGLSQLGPLEPCHGRPRPRHRRMGSITRHRPSSIRSLELSARHMVISTYTCARSPTRRGRQLAGLHWQFAAEAGLVCTFSLFRWFSTPTPLEDVRVPPLLTRKHERHGVRRVILLWIRWSASTKPLVPRGFPA